MANDAHNLTHEQHMRVAIDAAKKAKESGDVPFGCAVACDEKDGDEIAGAGEIVGVAGATNNTTGDVTDHAEMIALRAACRKLGRNNLSDCTIYCTNEPCAMCAAAIFQAKIPHVVIAISRHDLPELLRPRQIRIDHLAADSGYPIKIDRDFMKQQALQLFNGITKL